jgi:hypothetical protein
MRDFYAGACGIGGCRRRRIDRIQGCWSEVRSFGGHLWKRDFLPQRAQRTQRRGGRSLDLRMWRGQSGREPGERFGRTRDSLPLLRRQMQKHSQYTRNWNEVKRIIVPNGYSNDRDPDCIRACGEGLEENGNPKTQVQTANLGHPAMLNIRNFTVAPPFVSCVWGSITEMRS